ncbi:hypothetical protein D8771_32630 [Streptomyces albus]|uniref:Uncharacterized protein n=1 Tax=Streptomyces albus TaxID=1888 RepID=A0A8H1L4W4_9ACTN|nr:hypothetical protein D8771_32630 [Streptomyces albus]
MKQCPQCGGGAVNDPEHAGVVRCLSCWHVWSLPRETSCPGRLPRLMPALRVLSEHRRLSR